MSVKITELPILSELADNDVIAGVDVSGNVTSKIEMETLKDYIDTNTQYTAGTNIDITDNVISAPDVPTKEEFDSLSTIFNAFPTESDEDESMTLDGTAEVKFKKFDLEGNTSQYSTTGKNIINYVDNLRTSYSGLTSVINKDGSITTTGIPNSDYRCIVEYNINSSLENGETYTLWQETPQAHLLYLQINAIKKDGTGTSYYSLNTGNDYIQIPNVNKETYNYVLNIQTEQTSSWGTSSRTITNKYMLEKGNKTSFEPYTGGTASPNPSYPQPVNVVSGDNEIVVCGKNKLSPTLNDINETISSVKREGTNGIYTLSGTATAGGGGSVKYTLTNTYTIQNGDYLHLCNSTINTNSTIMLFNENDTQINNWSFNVINRVIDISSYAGQKIKSIGFYNNSSFSGSVTTSPMIINSNTVTNFEPYIGNTYNIDLPVENLWSLGNSYSSTSGNQWVLLDTAYHLDVGTYTISFDATVNKTVQFNFKDANNTSHAVNVGTNATFTTTVPLEKVAINITSANNTISNIQIEKGSKANAYTPYGTTPIELCSSQDGTKRDYFFHDKTLDKWYLHKEIGKVVFTGESSEGWQKFGTSSGHYRFRTYKTGMPKVDTTNTKSIMVSNYFENGSPNDTYVGRTCMSNDNGLPNFMYVCYESDDTDTIKKFNTWLSTHNLLVYYPLATPTNTEITYQPLIDQLNALELAQSKENQTNISQVNNDKPFIITAEAIKDLGSVLDRIELLES